MAIASPAPTLKAYSGRPTNRWLILQGFFLSLAYGSTVWVPRWAIARVQAEGFDLENSHHYRQFIRHPLRYWWLPGHPRWAFR